ncbi:MAG: UDP-N-acetylmuramoyl-tripeptide--D-alanyl-D-alanine ligase [Treponema sp.]|nr:UDP-N-acetylmuramoyl-tripeptide--D-alanyl-D-alanine ligase [Treponema sp.]
MESMLMTFDELSRSPGFTVFPGKGAERGFGSVSIDSRDLRKGALFVALTGSNTDGHSYIEAAIKSGASGIMAARSRLDSLNLADLTERWGKTLIVVDDTLWGLQNVAMLYLQKFPELLKIAITGSSGKTTTKEIAAAIAGCEKNVVCNSGNLNSETGLPLSVFNVRSGHQVGIFEAGMNRKGEIAELANVLKPDIALITNIGSAHIGILGSKEAIAEEKKKIFSQFTGTGRALIPDEDPYRDFLAKDVAGKVIFYGRDKFKKLLGTRDLGIDGAEINWAGKKVNFSLPGEINLKNALAALAIAGEIPVSDQSILSGLGSVKPLFGRGEIIRGRVTIIRDCYNSNPESLAAAVSYCDGLLWPGRKIYVIGSMLELGGLSEGAHTQMGRLLSFSNADMIFLYGPETITAAQQLSENGKPFQRMGKMDELKKALESCIRPGDLVLLKGSRGCALEELTPVLTGEKTAIEGGAEC